MTRVRRRLSHMIRLAGYKLIDLAAVIEPETRWK
jgi:hypothetical protein